MQWLNEPASWQRTGGVLTVSVDPGTDFWRQTSYGYIHDSGHVYGEVLAGDLDVSVRIRCTLGTQYDQAGIMLRADEQTWLKTGVEFFEGQPRLSTVLTLGRSSWTVTSLPEDADEIVLRVARRDDAVEVRYGTGTEEPTQLAALVYLPPEADVLAGVMCAAPEGPGFIVSFHDLLIEGRGWDGEPAAPAGAGTDGERETWAEPAPGRWAGEPQDAAGRRWLEPAGTEVSAGWAQQAAGPAWDGGDQHREQDWQQSESQSQDWERNGDRDREQDWQPGRDEDREPAWPDAEPRPAWAAEDGHEAGRPEPAGGDASPPWEPAAGAVSPPWEPAAAPGAGPSWPQTGAGDDSWPVEQGLASGPARQAPAAGTGAGEWPPQPGSGSGEWPAQPAAGDGSGQWPAQPAARTGTESWRVAAGGNGEPGSGDGAGQASGAGDDEPGGERGSRERARKGRTGRVRIGRERTGKDRPGKERAVKERGGWEQAGDSAGAQARGGTAATAGTGRDTAGAAGTGGAADSSDPWPAGTAADPDLDWFRQVRSDSADDEAAGAFRRGGTESTPWPERPAPSAPAPSGGPDWPGPSIPADDEAPVADAAARADAGSRAGSAAWRQPDSGQGSGSDWMQLATSAQARHWIAALASDLGSDWPGPPVPADRMDGGEEAADGSTEAAGAAQDAAGTAHDWPDTAVRREQGGLAHLGHLPNGLADTDPDGIPVQSGAGEPSSVQAASDGGGPASADGAEPGGITAPADGDASGDGGASADGGAWRDGTASPDGTGPAPADAGTTGPGAATGEGATGEGASTGAAPAASAGAPDEAPASAAGGHEPAPAGARNGAARPNGTHGDGGSAPLTWTGGFTRGLTGADAEAAQLADDATDPHLPVTPGAEPAAGPATPAPAPSPPGPGTAQARAAKAAAPPAEPLDAADEWISLLTTDPADD